MKSTPVLLAALLLLPAATALQAGAPETATPAAAPAPAAQTARPAADSKTGPVKVVFKVTGMSCEGCAAKLTKKVSTLPGVTVNRVDADDEVLDATIDLSKATKAQIIAAVAEKGYQVEGEKLALPVTGMSCAACAGKVKTTLAALPGVTVEKIVLKENKADIVMDPAKTDLAKISAALTAAGFGTTAGS